VGPPVFEAGTPSSTSAGRDPLPRSEHIDISAIAVLVVKSFPEQRKLEIGASRLMDELDHVGVRRGQIRSEHVVAATVGVPCP
jgi:hypothetical protein